MEDYLVFFLNFPLTRWSNGRKCDCLGSFPQVGFALPGEIAGLFSAFWKYLSNSMDSGIVPGVWQ